VIEGTLGPAVVDIRTFAKTGMFTYDPGFLATSSCESKITYIDGDIGLLYHRGYPIEQLAEHSSHLETAYLLFNGELPNATQLADYTAQVALEMSVPEQLKNIFQAFPVTSHPMAMLTASLGGLSAYYHDSLDLSNAEQRAEVALRLVAKLPTLSAYCYRHNAGKSFLNPRAELSYAANFLYLLNAEDETYVPNPVLVDALDKIFILHADHEQNASTSTVRLAGSSGANPYACIAAGIACLWGPSHGGANEAVLSMLEEIGDVSQVAAYMEGVKAKKYRLMGFGHRVYKNMDPRAKVMRKASYDVLNELGLHNDPLFKLALELETIALNDPYFIQKKLYPNVDFYSGIVLRALGIPTNMFTVLFALARTAGWIAQWNEMISEPGMKIGRPRQLYIGSVKRDYTPVVAR
jgi:citrate synthase